LIGRVEWTRDVVEMWWCLLSKREGKKLCDLLCGCDALVDMCECSHWLVYGVYGAYGCADDDIVPPTWLLLGFGCMYAPGSLLVV